METLLPVENPYCLFCGEMVVNPSAKSQCGKCGALVCEMCQNQGHRTCTECGRTFGQGASGSATPVTETPQTAPVPPHAAPTVPPMPESTSANSPGPAQAQAQYKTPVPPTPGPTSVPLPEQTPSVFVPPPSPTNPGSASMLSDGQFDLGVHQTSAEDWKSQGTLINPLLGPRLVFWSLISVLSIGMIVVFIFLLISNRAFSVYRPYGYSAPSNSSSYYAENRRINIPSAVGSTVIIPSITGPSNANEHAP
jgi:hypothetical protein